MIISCHSSSGKISHFKTISFDPMTATVIQDIGMAWLQIGKFLSLTIEYCSILVYFINVCHYHDNRIDEKISINAQP